MTIRNVRLSRLVAPAAAIAVVAVLVAVPLWFARSHSAATPTPAQNASGTASHRAIARADVPRLLAAFPAPPHAVRLAHRPSGIHAASTPVAPVDVATGSQWWSVPSPLASVREWLGAHTPAGAQITTTSSSSDHGAIVGDSVTYQWPGVTGVLSDRTLQASAWTRGSRVDIEIDASSAYLPGRPSGVTIPTNVTSITVTVNMNGHQGIGRSEPAGSSGPTTYTDPALVRRIVDLVNGLPVAPPRGGVVNCPADFGGDMLVTFADRTGAVLDRLDMGLSGCIDNVITGSDHSTADLASPDGYGDTDLGTQIRTILDIA